MAAIATLPLSLLVHMDYGSALSPRLITINGNDTWTAQCDMIARQMHITNTDDVDLTQYAIRFATFGSDVIEVAAEELRSIPLTALGIAALGWSAHCAAPPHLRPIRKKRSNGDKDEKKSDPVDKFAGLTPSNIIPKLRSAKVTLCA